MTKQEASECYSIPLELLNEYEKWGLCEAAKLIMGDWQYDDSDLQRMSMIMTLKDAGFTREEIEKYMCLVLQKIGTSGERLAILERKRQQTLNEIIL